MLPRYRDNLIDFLKSSEEQLCSDCSRRVSTNPIRVLDCKNSQCQDILKGSPKLVDNLCESCSRDFEKLKSLLRDNKIDFEVDINLLEVWTIQKTDLRFISGRDWVPKSWHLAGWGVGFWIGLGEGSLRIGKFLLPGLVGNFGNSG